MIQFYVYILCRMLFHYRLLQDIEYHSLCYAIGPCCLSIIYIYRSTCLLTPNSQFSPSPSSSLINISLFSLQESFKSSFFLFFSRAMCLIKLFYHLPSQTLYKNKNFIFFASCYIFGTCSGPVTQVFNKCLNVDSRKENPRKLSLFWLGMLYVLKLHLPRQGTTREEKSLWGT